MRRNLALHVHALTDAKGLNVGRPALWSIEKIRRAGRGKS
jgi:hypothetical protein